MIAIPLKLNKITAGYGAAPVLRELSLEAEGGELVALLGPSGCGKTTALKIIAGLLKPISGDVIFGDRAFTAVAPEQREAAMVFQKPLLFPYLTVGENVAFGLKMRKTPKRVTAQRVADALRMVQLEGYDARRPKELSGGQEQRVALARALVTQPRVLLLDEPFSALDVGLRAEMRALVRGLQRKLNITTIFVTHDQEEAATIADRIALLLDGRLEQFSPPRDFYIAPRTPAAARFFGWEIVAGERRGPNVETAMGRFSVPDSVILSASDGKVMIAFQPARARLDARDGGKISAADTIVEATLEAIIDLGARARFIVVLRSGRVIEVEDNLFVGSSDFLGLKSGSKISVRIPAEAIKLFSADETAMRAF